MTDILIVNTSKLVTGAADIAPVIAAINKQVVGDFAPAWGVSGVLHYGDAPAGAWRFTLQDTIDDPDALGYHVDENGQVEAFIDVAACQASGDDWRTCLGHEVLEALADPLCTRMSPDGVTMVETCFVGDTLVALANGHAVPIRELAGKEVWARALSDGGEIVAARARGQLTAKNRPVVRVSFRDGSFVICTPEHRFMLANGTWRKAAELSAHTAVRSDVFPELPCAKGADVVGIDPVTLTKRPIGIGRGPYRQHYFYRQLSAAVALAAHVSIALHSTFAHRVVDVLTMRSEEKMVGATARRVVARVADFLSSRYWAVVDLIGQAVRHVEPFAVAHLAIAGGSPRPVPYPAFGALIETFPKNIPQGGRARIIRDETGAQIAMALHPSPMGRAQAFRARGSRATSDRARLDRLLFRIMSAAQPLGSIGVQTSGHGASSHALIVDAVEESGNADVYDLTVPGYGNFVLGNGAVVHNCDPVEEDSYAIDSVPVTNFVLPAYFGFNAIPKYDQLGYLKSPAPALRPGGYVMQLVDGAWTSKFGEHAAVAPGYMAKRPNGRRAWRMRPAA